LRYSEEKRPFSPRDHIFSSGQMGVFIGRYFFYEDIVMKIGGDKYAKDVKEKQD
jgi:hypothetical protein